MADPLYIATGNPGKLRDFAVAAQAHGLSLLPLPGLDSVSPAPEEETTFAGNARQKAIYYSRLLAGATVLADDSGLEVDALDGAPGVRSARYAADAGFAPLDGSLTADMRNNLLLLQKLAGTPEDQRGARYRCVLAAARDGIVLTTAEGSVAGSILTAPRGTGGFGYDPLFYLLELERTMAEIDLETKEKLSHRGKALRALRDALRGMQ